jgi:hypothetical protein
VKKGLLSLGGVFGGGEGDFEGGGVEGGKGFVGTGNEVFDGGLKGGGDFYGIVGTGVGFLGAPGGKSGLLDVGLEDDEEVFFGQGAEAEPELFGVVIGYISNFG